MQNPNAVFCGQECQAKSYSFAMRTLLLLSAAFLLNSTNLLHAQSNRGADFYLARMAEYLGKSITLEVRSVSFSEYDSEAQRSIFYVHTVDGLISASVSKERLQVFERRYKALSYGDRPKILRAELRENKYGRGLLWVD
jgi:hypothetical protein